MATFVCFVLPFLLPVADAEVDNFAYTGGKQSWVCPSWVSSVQVDMAGAQGAPCIADTCGVAGLGGRLVATLTVTAGISYTIIVGGQGRNLNNPSGGYPGGGCSVSPVTATNFTGGGGGLSLIGPSANATLAWLVAGAGGGSGTSGAAGGSGGGTVGGVGGGSNPGSGGTVGNYVGQGQGGTG